ncbi:hypothetical protein Slala03_06600 [Streptomyces lavendulae subsp. lavendulae]|uniref:DUF397 domain-containing protein n=1 Tax=Streptomyces lavendulae TaxID=1914 RepID=UPI0024A356B6|nr:DUF397 domain-containing protein [Streptomyces lavendulae]GLV80971.1 hypothetical protein Slala03_06600 [Streptomyces lavendulae subsp. lavendulae]
MSTAETSPAQPSLAWFKSSYSGAEGGDCIEVATSPGTVHIRDSKQLGGPVLSLGPAAWAGFVELAAGHTV